MDILASVAKISSKHATYRWILLALLSGFCGGCAFSTDVSAESARSGGYRANDVYSLKQPMWFQAYDGPSIQFLVVIGPHMPFAGLYTPEEWSIISHQHVKEGSVPAGTRIKVKRVIRMTLWALQKCMVLPVGTMMDGPFKGQDIMLDNMSDSVRGRVFSKPKPEMLEAPTTKPAD